MTESTRPFAAAPSWPLGAIGHLLPKTRVWLAGGAVRDLLLHRVPHDWDMVLAGSGLGVARRVANALGGAYYALDRERGTGRAIVNHPTSGDTVTLDFAALRGPDIDQDLRARDFTINAIAMTIDGCLVDPTGGQADLAVGKLRMTSPTCFRDDPVRLLRAIRLSVQLGLAIEGHTAQRLRSEADAIRGVAPERVRAELVTLLSLPAAAEGIRSLATSGLLPLVLPEVDVAQASATVAEVVRIERALASGTEVLPGLPETVNLSPLHRHVSDIRSYLAANVGSETTRADLVHWASLFADASAVETGSQEAGTAAAQLAESRMRELRFSRNEIEFVRLTLVGQDAFRELYPVVADLHTSRRKAFRFFRATRDAGIAAALLFVARHTDLAAAVAATDALAEAYFLHHDEVVDPPLFLSGDDVMAMGTPQGPLVGRLIATLREAQAAGEVTSAADARALIERTLALESPREC